MFEHEKNLIICHFEVSEATLKRVYKYPPFVFSGEDMNHIRIIGKAVGFSSLII